MPRFMRSVMTTVCVLGLMTATPAIAAGSVNHLSGLARDSRAQKVRSDNCRLILPAIRAKAGRGDANSLELLAQIYDRGACGVDQDKELAAAAYRKLLKSHPNSAIANGYLRLFGIDRERDIATAISYLKRARRDRDPFAMDELAAALGESPDPLQRRESALFDQEGAREGDVRSLVFYAYDLVSGEGGTPIDRAYGMKILLDADSANNAWAARELASVYWDGIGVPVDMVRAEENLKRSIRLGNAYANVKLAVIYCVTGDVDDARTYSLLLAERARARLGSSPELNVQIARIYLSNVGVKPDYVRARKMLMEAVVKGDDSAIDDLAYLGMNGLGTVKDFADGVRLLRRAASLDDDYARKLLQNMEISAQDSAPLSKVDLELAEYRYRTSMPAAPQNNLSI